MPGNEQPQPPMGQQPPMPEAPQSMPDMGGAPDGGAPDGEEMPPMDGGNGESEFDTGFDAGVEADEDEDPKKFIQQLTGKLSQSLNSYNNEVGDDDELSKYVGKMIVKAAAKGLDEKGKKELIKSINQTEGDEGEDEGDLPPAEGDEPDVDEPDMEQPEMDDEPLNESIKKLGQLLGKN